MFLAQAFFGNFSHYTHAFLSFRFLTSLLLLSFFLLFHACHILFPFVRHLVWNTHLVQGIPFSWVYIRWSLVYCFKLSRLQSLKASELITNYHCTRIQQLQLLGREVNWQQDHDKLWRQLEAEINLHRHKTVVRACRANISAAQNGMQVVAVTMRANGGIHVTCYGLETNLKHIFHLKITTHVYCTLTFRPRLIVTSIN